MQAMDKEGCAALSGAAGVQRRMAQLQMEGEGIPPAASLECVGAAQRVEAQRCAPHQEEVRVQEAASQGKECSLVGITRSLRRLLVLLLGLLAVRLLDDEGSKSVVAGKMSRRTSGWWD